VLFNAIEDMIGRTLAHYQITENPTRLPQVLDSLMNVPWFAEAYDDGLHDVVAG
jgi:hypothetical protein